MFKKEFVPAILDGTKTSTFRPIPKREIYKGMLLDMRVWSGLPYRSKQVRFAEAVLCDFCDYMIYPMAGIMSCEGLPGGLMDSSKLDEMARADGFGEARAFFDFFRRNYKGKIVIRMTRMKWHREINKLYVNNLDECSSEVNNNK
jgi:hypothetical protein